MSHLIFNLGLFKTGTTSLHAAMDMLGFRSIHDWKCEKKVVRAIDENKDWLYYLKQYNTFTEIWPHLQDNFPQYDVQNPGSKFILTIRDMDERIESYKKHLRRYLNIRKEPRHCWKNCPLLLYYKMKNWDKTFIQQDFLQHNQRVQDYFKDRPDDLLVINICAGEGWEPLCKFLDKPVPDIPFPKENVNPKRRKR